MSVVRRSARSKPPSLKAELNTAAEQKVDAARRKEPTQRRTSERGTDDSREDVPVSNDVSVTPPTSSRKRKTASLETPAKVKVQPSIQDTVLDDDALLPSGGCGLDMGVWSHYNNLRSKLPGRESQIEILLTLFGEPSYPAPSLLYLYGNSGTGKTLTIKTLLDTLQVPHVVVNCVECYCSRLLFENVLNKIADLSRSPPVSRCDNMASLVSALQSIIRGSRKLKQQTVYIVLDHAERLREQEATLLPALLRLKELTGCEVCVILVSELVFEKFFTGTGLSEPLPIHFNDYTKAETLSIMSLDYDGTGSPAFYQTFTNHIWNVFHNVCRDLGELRHLSAVLYPKYREPVDSGLIGCMEARRLWRHIEPYFKQVMGHIYLREMSTTQWERAMVTPTLDVGGVVRPGDQLELPYYSKYLLMASYLASYNPAKVDRRFFSKMKQAKLRKSHRPTKEKPNYQLLGPKPFPLDRLMAIFYSILEEDLPPSAHIYSQVSSLATLQLLTQVSSRDSLDAPKYKCLVTLDYIRTVARSVGFDIVQYLYDFN